MCGCDTGLHGKLPCCAAARPYGVTVSHPPVIPVPLRPFVLSLLELCVPVIIRTLGTPWLHLHCILVAVAVHFITMRKHFPWAESPEYRIFPLKTCPSLSTVCLSVRYCPAFSQGKRLHAATGYGVLEHHNEGGQGHWHSAALLPSASCQRVLYWAPVLQLCCDTGPVHGSSP